MATKVNTYDPSQWATLAYNPVSMESLGLGMGESGVTGQDQEALRNSNAWGTFLNGKALPGGDGGVYKLPFDQTPEGKKLQSQVQGPHDSGMVTQYAPGYAEAKAAYEKNPIFYVQRPGSTQENKYDYERAYYRLAKDPKTGKQVLKLDETRGWKAYDERSTKDVYKDFAEKAAITAAAATGVGALGEALGGAGAGSGIGAASGAGHLTPALLESGLGTAGYGASSATGTLGSIAGGAGAVGGSGLIPGTGTTGLQATAGAIPPTGGGIGSLAATIGTGLSTVGNGLEDIIGRGIGDLLPPVGQSVIPNIVNPPLGSPLNPGTPNIPGIPNTPNVSGTPNVPNVPGGGGNTGGGPSSLSDLLNLYSQYQQHQQMGDVISQLSDMYGPNSPYAKDLQDNLQRRDSAAGRSSQYGPREVELQAKLASQHSQNLLALPSIYQNMGGNLNGMLGSGQRLFEGIGGMQGITDLFKGAGSVYDSVTNSDMWGDFTDWFGGFGDD